MPTPDQLNHVNPTEGDGSAQTTNDDGSITTDWPDGTQRVDYPDQSAMVAFPDGSVLNLYGDGSTSLNDVNGNALDPATGAPLGAAGPVDVPPDLGPDKLLRLMHGDDRIADLQEASELAKAFGDALEGNVNPAEWVVQWIEMVLTVIKAVETEERGCYLRGWCYGVLYSALDMGTPPEPTFSGSLGGADQDQLDQQYWDKGVSTAAGQLADGASGLSLRNRVLLRVARNGASPAATVREMYVAACDHTEDKALKEAYQDILGWPTPTGA